MQREAILAVRAPGAAPRAPGPRCSALLKPGEEREDRRIAARASSPSIGLYPVMALGAFVWPRARRSATW
jgi:hypothetical protein